MSMKLYNQAFAIAKKHLEDQYIGHMFQAHLKEFLSRSETIYYAGKGFDHDDLLNDVEMEWNDYLGNNVEDEE